MTHRSISFVRTWAQRPWNQLLDCCFPPLCEVCGNGLAVDRCLCIRCQKKLRTWPIGCVPKLELVKESNIHLLPPLLVYEKDRVAAHLIHRFKYNKRLALGRQLAERYAHLMPRPVPYEELIPVPMHWRRKLSRGFNQSTIIAEVLSRQLEVPVLTGCLVRNRYTRRQVGQDAQARWDNMAARFVVRNPKRIQGRRVALVDDVLTTGATTWHGAQALLSAGATRVYVLALAAAARSSMP